MGQVMSVVGDFGTSSEVQRGCGTSAAPPGDEHHSVTMFPAPLSFGSSIGQLEGRPGEGPLQVGAHGTCINFGVEKFFATLLIFMRGDLCLNF